MALMYPKFTDKMKFNYWFDEDCTEDPWIFATYMRKDFGPEFCISAPSTASCIPPALVDDLETTTHVDWNAPYNFIAIDHQISGVLVEMAHRLTKTEPGTHKAAVAVDSCVHYVPGPELSSAEARAPPPGQGFIIKPLGAETGPKLLCEGHPNASPELEEQCYDMITRIGRSAAVYLNDGEGASGHVVSWCFLFQCGHMGVATKESYRLKGYARRCIQSLTAQLLDPRHGVRIGGEGWQYSPCAIVGQGNDASHALHKSAGWQITHAVNFITFGRSPLKQLE